MDDAWMRDIGPSFVVGVDGRGTVLVTSFDDVNDAAAAEVLAQAYPGRSVVTVDARPLFARGGGVHCITQQQPTAPG